MSRIGVTRRDFLKAAGFGAAAVATPGDTLARTPSTSGKPNILMIMVDDLGYGDLSSYGATDLRTPHIDRLVTAGVRFDNFYANCPVCSPTRASLLTGRYPDLVGVPGVIRTHLRNNWGCMSSHAVLLPKLLKPAGYHTAIVGKWHLGLESPNRPNDRGFDHFSGYLGDMMDDYYKSCSGFAARVAITADVHITPHVTATTNSCRTVPSSRCNSSISRTIHRSRIR